MKKISKITLISIVMNVVLIALFMYKLGIPYIKYRMSPTVIASSGDQYYAARKGLLENLKIIEQDIVFLGDSLIDRNEWADVFNNNLIKNRGIDGETTDQLIQRLNTVTVGNPQKIFLMVGTNDLNNGMSIEHAVNNYDRIIRTIKNDSPNTKIYVHSVLPVNTELNISSRENTDILELNGRLKDLAKENSVQFINLLPYLAIDNDLKKEYTNDGVHLTLEGYSAWANAIEKYVKE